MDASKLKEFKDGVHAVQDCISNLNKWEKEIKKEDERLLALSKQNHALDASEEYPIRSKASSPIASDVADSSKQKDDSKKPLNGKTKIHAYDYAAWDKYDADAEVKKIDEVKTDKASCEQKKRSSPSPSDAGAPAAQQKQRKKGATSACPASTDEDKIKALKLKDEGNSLFSAGKYQDAVNTYTSGIELDASNHILHANRAMAYIKLNEGRAAERDCDACIAQAPSYLKAYLRRGVARLMQGKLRLALLDYNEVLQVEPWNKEAKAQMAEIQRKLSAGAEPSQQRTDDAGQRQSTPNVIPARSKKSLQKLEVIEVNKESEIPPFILPMQPHATSSDSRRFAPVNKTQTTRLPKQTSESSAASSSSIQNVGSAPDRSSSPSNITVNSHEKQPKSPQDSALKISNKAKDSQMNTVQSSTSATQSSTSATQSSTSATQSSTSATQSSTSATQSSTSATQSSISPTDSHTSPMQPSTSATQPSTSTTQPSVSPTHSQTVSIQPSKSTTTQPCTSDPQVSAQTMLKSAVAQSCASLPPVPRTSHQFMTAWSKVTAASHDSAISWLQGVKPSLLHKFELETECVGSVVHHLLVWRKALSAEQHAAELTLVHDYVLAFANSRGFDLQILFLEDQQKRDLLELWELLETSNTRLPRKLEEMKEAISTL